MPYKDGSLTRGESAFLAHYAEHQDREKAEKAAGLMPKSGYAILSRPEIQARLVAETHARLVELAPVAVARLRGLLSSDKTPAATLQRSIEYTLGMLIGDNAIVVQKEMHEMTPEEIGQAIEAFTARAAMLAKPVQDGAVFD